jgi:hypothetical protein
MQTSALRFFKIVFLFCCISLFAKNTSAQILLSTGFENAVPPLPQPGWVVANTNESNWQSLKDFKGYGNAYIGNKCMYLADSYYGDQSDAWLISPSVTFEAGKKYSISFYYENQFYQENKLQVTIGGDTLPASQTYVLWSNSFKTDYYTKAQINFTPTKSGARFLGIHCVTPKTYTYIYLDKFEVEEVNTFEPLNPSVDLQSITTNSATARWESVSGATHYEYGLSDTLVPPSIILKTNADSINLSNLISAKKYFFYVRAVSAAGKSPWAVSDFSTAYDTANIAALNCGQPFANEFVGGNGLFLNLIFSEPYFGNEFFHTFTPTVNGFYNLDIYNVNDGQTVGFAYKDANEGAGPAGWNAIGVSGGFQGNKYLFGPLVAGKKYIILEKTLRPVTLPTSYEYGIECNVPQPTNDSCQNAETISPTAFTETCTGAPLTTLGATYGDLKENQNACGAYDGISDDEIWIKFTAIADAQLFRFSNMVYTNSSDASAAPGMYFDIFSKSCNLFSLVDCGYLDIKSGITKNIYSYLLKKDSTYYVRMFTADLFTYASFNLCIMDLGVTLGGANTCTEGLSYPINHKTDNNNTKIWVPFTDKSYKLIAEINADKDQLSKVTAGVYINKGPLRKDSNGQYYLDRNINIQSAKQPKSAAQVRLYFSNEELNKLIAQAGSGVSSVNDINVTRSDDGCSSMFENNDPVFIVPSARGDYDADNKYVEFTTDSLSTFYLHGGDKILPVQLLSFSASLNSNNVLLNWSTAVEKNAANFIIERSVDGNNFSQIGIIAAKGNSTAVSNYSYVDAKLYAGNYFYRLQMTDKDRSKMYSKIINETIVGNYKIQVSPNPFKNNLTITSNETNACTYNISIIDMSGRVVSTFTKAANPGYNQINIAETDLLPGTYILKIQTPDGCQYSKIVKE